MINISDEEILNLEIYHDNKDNFNLIIECNFFLRYDKYEKNHS